MKTKVRTTVAVLASALCFSQARAQQDVYEPQATAPSYNCRLSGEISGVGVAIGVGGQILTGEGQLDCTYVATGARQSTPVNIRMAGGGLGFEISDIKNVVIRSTEVTVADVSKFYDTFSIGAETGAELGRDGVSYDVAIRLSGRNGLGFDVCLQSKDVLGLGAHLYAMGFESSPR